MKVRYLLALGAMVIGSYSSATLAQQGELIASDSYLKPGCEWVYQYSDGPSGPHSPSWRVAVLGLDCGNGYILGMNQFYNGRTDCQIVGISNNHTLTGNTCDDFELRTKTIQPPSAPGAISHTSWGSISCPNQCPTHWASWSSTDRATEYEYNIAGQSGTTSSTSVTLYIWNGSPEGGSVRACNDEGCGPWKTVSNY